MSPSAGVDTADPAGSGPVVTSVTRGDAVVDRAASFTG
jgi:hypothetical protein